MSLPTDSAITFLYVDNTGQSSIKAVTRERDELLSYDELGDFLDEYSKDWLCPTIFDFNRASSYIANKFRRGRGNVVIANFDDPFVQFVMDGLNQQSFRVHQLHDARLEGMYLVYSSQHNEYDRPFKLVDGRWYLNPHIKVGEILRLSFPITVDFRY